MWCSLATRELAKLVPRVQIPALAFWILIVFFIYWNSYSLKIDMEWQKICAANEFEGENRKMFEVNGHKILVSRIEGKLYSIDGLCSHMGGDLSKGRTENNKVICPKHHAVFNLETGHVEKNINGFFKAMTRKDAKDLNAYEIRENNGNIEINI